MLRSEFLGYHHTFNFEKNREGKSSLEEFAEQDDLVANGEEEGQRAGAMAKQLTVKDNDKAKIDLIKSGWVSLGCKHERW